MNHQQKGLELEKKISLTFHQIGTPFVIEPSLLRFFGAGQVDLARLLNEKKKIKLELLEVKAKENLSYQQIVRLRIAQKFLSELLQIDCGLNFVFLKQE